MDRRAVAVLALALIFQPTTSALEANSISKPLFYRSFVLLSLLLEDSAHLFDPARYDQNAVDVDSGDLIVVSQIIGQILRRGRQGLTRKAPAVKRTPGGRWRTSSA